MNKHYVDFSMKNVTVPPRSVYEVSTLVKIIDFIYRLRLKAFFSEGSPDKNVRNKEIFGLKTYNPPQLNSTLAQFDRDLLDLVKNIYYLE